MKPYALKYFSTDFLKDADITKIGMYVWTPYSNIKDEFKDEVDEPWTDDYDEECVPIFENNLFKFCIDPMNYEYCMGSYFEEELLDEFFDNVIKPFNHYMVCAYHCDWRGRNGYKICDSLAEAFCRDYDVTQYYVGGSGGGKSICICEHSHDVPMGHTTMIIGLTDKEYEKFNHWDVAFETVIDFADRNSKSIIEI